VNRGQVVLDKPIKDLGMHSVSVVLHPEVVVRKITLNVARSPEEAELQASGKSIQELAAEAEAAAEFEIAELFDDRGRMGAFAQSRPGRVGIASAGWDDCP
jgi:large subunit ribosomal protein L9